MISDCSNFYFSKCGTSMQYLQFQMYIVRNRTIQSSYIASLSLFNLVCVNTKFDVLTSEDWATALKMIYNTKGSSSYSIWHNNENLYFLSQFFGARYWFQHQWNIWMFAVNINWKTIELKYKYLEHFKFKFLILT